MFISALFTCWILAATMQAGDAPAPGQPLLGATVPPYVTRADLARAYLRLERALRAHPPAKQDLPRVSRSYDTAAMHFFSGKNSQAVQAMDALADSLAADRELATFHRVARAVKVQIAPPVGMLKRRGAMHVKFSPLYPVPLDAPLDLKLVLRPLNGEKPVLERDVTLAPGAAMPNFTMGQPEADVGTYTIELLDPASGERLDVGRWFVTDIPLDAQRVANGRRLTGVRRDDPTLYAAWIACSARNELLTDRPGEQETIRFHTDLIAMAREVSGEIDSLLQRRNPYVNRPGDWWRVFSANAMLIPARVYAPPGAVRAGKPMPLVVALHGAGMDENAFIDGYGDGAIRRLADEHGFVVVAPSTYWCVPNPGALPAIVDALAAEYSIDRARVYAVGHSLGATAAANMAARHPEALAGVVLLAGGGELHQATKLPPTLVIAGGLDPVAPPEKLETAARQAAALRLPVEFELMPDHGHVLMANDAVSRAVEWLLQHGAHE